MTPKKEANNEQNNDSPFPNAPNIPKQMGKKDTKPQQPPKVVPMSDTKDQSLPVVQYGDAFSINGNNVETYLTSCCYKHFDYDSMDQRWSWKGETGNVRET